MKTQQLSSIAKTLALAVAVGLMPLATTTTCNLNRGQLDIYSNTGPYRNAAIDVYYYDPYDGEIAYDEDDTYYEGYVDVSW